MMAIINDSKLGSEKCCVNLNELEGQVKSKRGRQKMWMWYAHGHIV
jgi:hypothetical protein